MNNIKRIVLTGGPCAGKTTALVRIIEHFSNLGFKVFTVPEVPTMYSQGGWSYLTPNPKLYYEGELAILQTQLALEDSFMRLAETCTKPTFVVCDRGTMDISAYISPEMWQDITAKCGTCSNQLRERYDAVLHLVSAADGAEQYYTVANNANRCCSRPIRIVPRFARRAVRSFGKASISRLTFSIRPSATSPSLRPRVWQSRKMSTSRPSSRSSRTLPATRNITTTTLP